MRNAVLPFGNADVYGWTAPGLVLVQQLGVVVNGPDSACNGTRGLQEPRFHSRAGAPCMSHAAPCSSRLASLACMHTRVRDLAGEPFRYFIVLGQCALRTAHLRHHKPTHSPHAPRTAVTTRTALTTRTHHPHSPQSRHSTPLKHPHS